MPIRNRLAATGAACFISVASCGAVLAQAAELPLQPPVLPPSPMEVEAGSPYTIYPIRDGLYMISGPQSNVTVQIGRDGVLVVDSGLAPDAPALLAQIRRLSRRPIMYLLNTSGDPAQIGGNVPIAASGVLLQGGNTRPKAVAGSEGAPILAHEEVMNRLTAEGKTEGLPTQTYFVAQKDIYYNNEAVSLIHAPGHSAGDSFVMFRRGDVIAAGNVYTPDRYPVIDVKNGGSIQKLLASLNHLIRLTVPEFNQQGGTYVVPGRGRLSDEGDIQEYRDMVTFIRDRIQAMIDKKMTLAQIKASRPTLDYDPRFGAKAGENFVEQVYLSLTSEGVTP